MQSKIQNEEHYRTKNFVFNEIGHIL